jgi:predicted Zn-dependent peptidase
VTHLPRNRAAAHWPRLGVAIALIIPCAVSAQSAFPRITTPPPQPATPRLTLPNVDTARLGNGLTILVSRNAEVPVVTANLIIDGGARTETDLLGLATFTAGMLDEGAAGKSGLELAEAVEFLGANMSTGAGWETFNVNLNGPKRTIGDAMALMADVVMRPTFAAADVARERALRQAGLITARDNPGVVANRVFSRNIFPNGHPFHRNITGDSASTARLDSAAVRSFWTRAADPRKATLIVTGDVTPAEARQWATRHFGEWRTPAQPLGKRPAEEIATPAAAARRVILVDKPGAPQSVVIIGAPGVARDNPDYAAIQLLNTILGGSFSSRLNDILREQRGYSYGAGSGWNFSPVVGPFTASSQVRTDVTDSSVAVFFHEFERIRNEPVTPVELERGRNYIVLGALDSYETAGQVAGAIAGALQFGHPLQRTADELLAISRLTAADVQAAAQKYLDPSKLTVVIVGDLNAIRPGIERLNLGPVEVQTY